MFSLPLYAIIVVTICSVVFTLSCVAIIYYKLCRQSTDDKKRRLSGEQHYSPLQADDWALPLKPRTDFAPEDEEEVFEIDPMPRNIVIQSPSTEEIPKPFLPSETIPVLPDKVRLSPVTIQPPNKSPRRMSKLPSFDEEREEKILNRYADMKVAQLELSVHYNDKGEIVMSLNKVDLVHSSVNISTAYVELRRHPDRKLSQPQMIYSKTMDSLIGKNNHKYVFKLAKEQLSETIFTFYLWSTNKTSRVCESGECKIQFNDQDYDFKKGFVYRGDFYLINRSPEPTDTTITLMLKYHPSSSKLCLDIENVKNLPRNVGWRTAINETAREHFLQPSPYVKVHLVHANGDKEKQKTKPVKGFDVTFGQSFNFDVPIQELKSVRLLVQVVYSSVMTGYTLGVVEFSADSTGREGEHWRRMEQGLCDIEAVFQEHVVPLEPDEYRPKLIHRKTALVDWK